MKAAIYTALLLSVSTSALAGDWVFQLQSDYSVKVVQEGGSSEFGQGVLSFRDDSAKTLGVRITPAGVGQCNNGMLTGGPDLDALKIQLSAMTKIGAHGTDVQCGDIYETTDADYIALKNKVPVMHLAPEKLSPAFYRSAARRVLIGNVTFFADGKEQTSNSIYLDTAPALVDQPVLSAAFSTTSIFTIGDVGPFMDASNNLQLTVTKTKYASVDALNYTLRFESLQKGGDQYLLKSSLEEAWIPYLVAVQGKNIGPADIYHGTLPAVSTTGKK